MDFLYFFLKVTAFLVITFCLFMDRSFAQEILGLRSQENVQNLPLDSHSTRLSKTGGAYLTNFRNRNILKRIPKASSSGDIKLIGGMGRVPSLLAPEKSNAHWAVSGAANVKIYELPFHFEFNYSRAGSYFNGGKYFHLNFDANQYINTLNTKTLQEGTLLNSLKMTLLKDLQKAEQHLYYLIDTKKKGMQSLRDSLPTKGLSDISDSINLKESVFINSDNPDNPISHPDTLMGLTNKVLPSPIHVEDLNTSLWAKQMTEEILIQENKLEKIRNRLLSIDGLALKHKKRRDFDGGNLIQIPKYQSFFKHVSRFDIGRFYPEGNEFLVRDLSIKGLNMRYENRGMQYSWMYGLITPSITNSLFSDNPFVSSSNFIKDFFTFNSGLTTRKIAIVNAGPGSDAQNHLHLGLMYAFGSSTYSAFSQQSLNNQYSNAVLELNLSRRINKIGQFHFVLAKSVLINQGFSNTYSKEVVYNNLFDMQNHTWAAVFSFSSKIKKTNTSYALSIRNTDSYFCSYGLQSSSPGRLRYDLKLDQVLSKKISSSISYFRSIQKDFSSETFQYIQSNYLLLVIWKPSRSLYLRGSYQPFSTQVIRATQLSNDKKNMNTGLSLNYAPHLKTISINMGIQTQFCNLQDEFIRRFSKSLSGNFSIGKGPWNDVSSFYYLFATASNPSQKNQSLQMRNEFSYQWKNNMKVFGGLAILSENEGHWGMISYSLKTRIPLGIYFNVEAGFDKMPQSKSIPMAWEPSPGDHNYKAFLNLNMLW